MTQKNNQQATNNAGGNPHIPVRETLMAAVRDTDPRSEDVQEGL